MLDRSILYSMASSQNKLPLRKEPAGKKEDDQDEKQEKEQSNEAPLPIEQEETAESRITTNIVPGEKDGPRDEEDASNGENSSGNNSPISGGDSGDEDLKAQVQKSFGMLQAKWDEMFARLVTFREKHGHCLVPNRYTEDPQLGSWVSTQRRQYKILTSGSSESTPMTPERANKLNSIGFVWATKDPRHVPWETRYEELCQFVEKFGHAQVPIGWEENVQLSNWVSTQRQEYKLLQKGRSSRLDADRIKLLNDLGFVWEAQRGGPRRGQKATVSVPDEPRVRVGGFSDSTQHMISSSAARPETKSSKSIAVASGPRQTPSAALSSAAARSHILDMQDAAAVAQYLESSRATNQQQFMQFVPNRLLGNFMSQIPFQGQPTLNELTMMQRQHSGMGWPPMYSSASPNVMAVPNITASAAGLGMQNPFMAAAAAANMNQQMAEMTNMNQRAAAASQQRALQELADEGSLAVESVSKKPASQKRSRQRSHDSESTKSKKSREESGSERAAKAATVKGRSSSSSSKGRGSEKAPPRSKVPLTKSDAASKP